MLLSQYNGEDAIDKLADLIEPAAEIFSDKEMVKEFNAKNRMKALKIALKNHKRAVIEIMAVINDKDPDTYKPTVLELPAMLLNLFNDPDIVSLFTLQGQKTENRYSGSATENTEENGG